MPDTDDERVQEPRDERIEQQAERPTPAVAIEHGIHHPHGQAAEEKNSGAVDQQLMLQHVHAEEEAFADLVERRAHREVEDHECGVKLRGLAPREGGAGGEARAQRAGEDRVEPTEEHDPADEVGFIVPVAPVDHGKKKGGPEAAVVI